MRSSRARGARCSRRAGSSVAGVVAVFAPAKLTLSLRITGVRADGYHEIDAEMTSLDFGDRLEIEPCGGASVARMLDADGAELAREQTGIAEPGDNLVLRALSLAGRRARVTVHKRIPFGAGLGGGSADAAAVLRWAGVTGAAAAVALGADVAFCLAGGRARVRGIGERVQELPYVPERYTLLLTPVHCATAAVYAAWDEMGGPAGAAGNDLEPAALRVAPALRRWRDELGNASGQAPRLAGSGSAWFVPGSYPGPRRVVAAALDRADRVRDPCSEQAGA